MSTIQIIGGSLLLILCVVVTLVVTLQESKGGGLGALAGEASSGTFFDKNRGKTKAAMLVRATTFSGIALAVLTLVVLFVS